MRTLASAVFAAAVIATAAAPVAAQPRRPTPAPTTPAPTSTPTPAPAPMSSTEKPTPMWEGECLGALVYVSSKTWRECCLLCSAGDDSPSDAEKAEAEKEHKTLVVNNYFSVNGLGRSSAGDRDGDGAQGGGAAGEKKKEGGGGERSEGRSRNRMGGLSGLRGVSMPSVGGFDSK